LKDDFGRRAVYIPPFRFAKGWGTRAAAAAMKYRDPSPSASLRVRMTLQTEQDLCQSIATLQMPAYLMILVDGCDVCV
jgi:hypothetical protein